MNVCIPILEDQGLKSRVSGHFGSAPRFLLLDTAVSTTRVVENGDRVHAHGRCSPLAALRGEPLQSVVVGGIGKGALRRLCDLGVRVYRAPQAATVQDVVAALASQGLEELGLDGACMDGHGHQHAHGRGRGAGHGDGGRCGGGHGRRPVGDGRHGPHGGRR